MVVFHQSLANDLSQFECWFLGNRSLWLSYLPLSPDEIDWEIYTYMYGFIDLDVASLHDGVTNAHGLASFQFVRNVYLDVRSSFHDIKVFGLSPMASH